VGDFGFKSCEKQPAEALAFFFICEFSLADLYSKLELSYGGDDAVYNSVILNLMLFPKFTNVCVPPKSRRILRAAKTRSRILKASFFTSKIWSTVFLPRGGSHAISLAEKQTQIVQNLTASYFNAKDFSEEKTKLCCPC